VERVSDLPRAVAGTPVGRDVRLGVVRDGMPMTLTAKVAALDAKEPREADRGERAKPTLGLCEPAGALESAGGLPNVLPGAAAGSVRELALCLSRLRNELR
jgi:hypothetical protein